MFKKAAATLGRTTDLRITDRTAIPRSTTELQQLLIWLQKFLDGLYSFNNSFCHLLIFWSGLPAFSGKARLESDAKVREVNSTGPLHIYTLYRLDSFSYTATHTRTHAPRHHHTCLCLIRTMVRMRSHSISLSYPQFRVPRTDTFARRISLAIVDQVSSLPLNPAQSSDRQPRGLLPRRPQAGPRQQSAGKQPPTGRTRLPMRDRRAQGLRARVEAVALC